MEAAGPGRAGAAGPERVEAAAGLGRAGAKGAERVEAAGPGRAGAAGPERVEAAAGLGRAGAKGAERVEAAGPGRAGAAGPERVEAAAGLGRAGAKGAERVEAAGPGRAGAAGSGRAEAAGAERAEAAGSAEEGRSGGRADFLSAPIVLDVGTGSGALAVTLAAERPLWRVTASDLSEAALQVARGNARKHGANGRISFVQGDLLTPFLKSAADGGLVVDILVSNPPYIPSSDIPGLQREVRDHEPHLALDGGDDGLNPYRTMARQLKELPQLPRIVAWEVGAGQARDVADLLRAAADWKEIRFVPDYAGIERHVVAVR
ncbi:class I SAM-dependent methyltransferase [Cohnella sp.]|uniref:N5-glutamine methyltransferase family protein n=1 Tax=Cohnella sp. TaxID=1883426 RepID=UPI003561FCF6